jgi:hypothetical protein
VRLGGVIDVDVIAKGDPAGTVAKRHYVAPTSPSGAGAVPSQ